MSKRGVALLLVVTATIAIGALALDFWLASMASSQSSQARVQAFQINDLNEQLNALESSRRAYGATGQASADWADRVSKEIDDLTAAIAARRAAGLQDSQAVPEGVARLETFRWAEVRVALLFVLGVAVYLGRSATGRGTPTTTQMFRELPPPVKPAGAQAPAQPVVAAPPVAVAHPPASHMGRPANLSAAAELCVDLARVMDADDVPALLERTATILDARGIIVWAIDSDGAQLRPSLSHGYSDKVLNKLRTLQVDSDNVTSLAFRSLQPQAMNGATVTDSAAIAIPLLTGSGCVGVMAAELKHNRPPADLMPIARIVGAQFSALVAPTEAPGLKTARA